MHQMSPLNLGDWAIFGQSGMADGLAALGAMQYRDSRPHLPAPLKTGIPWLDRSLGGGLAPGSVNELAGYDLAVCQIAAQVMAMNEERQILVINLIADQENPLPVPKHGRVFTDYDPLSALCQGLSVGRSYELVIVLGGPLLGDSRSRVGNYAKRPDFCSGHRLRMSPGATLVLSAAPCIHEPDALVCFEPFQVRGQKVAVQVTGLRRFSGVLEISDSQPPKKIP
jgi:hypothetical protein